MSRPIYESEDNRTKENLIAAKFADELGLDWIKNPRQFTAIDHILLRKGTKTVVGVAEAKCREKDWTWDKLKQFGGVLIDLEKFEALVSVLATGLDAYVVVSDAVGEMRWASVVRIFNRVKVEAPYFYPSFVFTGRTDRNDYQDIGVKVIIPTAAFDRPKITITI